MAIKEESNFRYATEILGWDLNWNANYVMKTWGMGLELPLLIPKDTCLL